VMTLQLDAWVDYIMDKTTTGMKKGVEKKERKLQFKGGGGPIDAIAKAEYSALTGGLGNTEKHAETSKMDQKKEKNEGFFGARKIYSPRPKFEESSEQTSDMMPSG